MAKSCRATSTELIFVYVAHCTTKHVTFRKYEHFTVLSQHPKTTSFLRISALLFSLFLYVGVALTEAIANAVERVTKDTDFTTLVATKSIGYDIRDSCGDPNTAKSAIYNMNMEKTNYKVNTSDPNPSDIVISSFTNSEVNLLSLLNVEDTPQLSFDKKNARLRKTNDIRATSVKNLISVYPESTMKILALVDIIKSFGFEHVYSIASNTFQGQLGVKTLVDELERSNICKSDPLYINSNKDVVSALKIIVANPLIKAVVVHCNKDAEIELYKQAQIHNVTDRIFLSTQNWHDSQADIKPYAAVVEGMVFVKTIQENDGFKTYLKQLARPYTDKPWLDKLYETVANKDEAEVIVQLVKYSDITSYAFDGVYAVAYALKSKLSSKDPQSLLDSFKGLKFLNHVNGVDIKFTEHLTTIATKFELYNTHGDTEDGFKSLRLGQWNSDSLPPFLRIDNSKISFKNGSKEKPISVCSELCKMGYQRVYNNDKCCWVCEKCPESTVSNITNAKSLRLGQWNSDSLPPFLRIDNSKISFKNGSKEKPISVCSELCKMGYQRVYNNDKCCWVCEKCPESTVSNITNANVCVSCPEGHVAKPDQTECVRYKLERFHLFGGAGAFLIFLIVIGACLCLFGLGIISQNSDHELVKAIGYKMLVYYILGCLICFISPIPLLVGPTVTSCSVYIAIFNIGLTIPFSVLIARSALINSYYDQEGKTSRQGICSFPRAIAISVILLIQILILIVGIAVDPPLTMHNLTDAWNVRYFECSSWASYVFWISFGYNIALSIVGNFLSCNSTKMEENCEELKYILITYCIFYLLGLTEICIFYRAHDDELAGGQGYMCVLFGLGFFMCFIWPKIYIILFRSKEDHKTINREALMRDHEHDHDIHMTTAIHAATGFRGRGVVQMKIKEESIDDVEAETKA